MGPKKDNDSSKVKRKNTNIMIDVKTLRTGAFKLSKCTFPVSKQFKSTFIMCFFKYL